ncbi:MAG: hypothetical protein M3O36_11410 [Myxococcota bacterium]|nr:hypothetical protein [Myxococcota bacterium]
MGEFANPCDNPLETVKAPRHDVPPRIGSSEWYRELVPFGVQRQELESKLDSAIDGRAGEELDPHCVSFFAALSVERGALWLLLHELRPGHAALMYLRQVWLGLDDGDARERRWFVRQYASMLLHGGEDVRSSAQYSLWVDFFESAESEVSFVFHRLLGELPRSAWVLLLADTGPIPWAVK